MAFILVVVVMFYLQARHAEITEKYNNINTTGQIDMKTIEFKPPTDAGNRSTFPEDKYPGANYELTRSTVRTAGIGMGGSFSSVSNEQPPEPRTTDIYTFRDCKVYFTDDIESCDNQVESSTKTCSYNFDGWKEFDTYKDNNGNTLTYPIKKYKPDASNTDELINSHFTSKCFKEFDNGGKGTAKRFEYKENRIVKFDSKGDKDNTEIDTNIFGGKRYTSIQFMNGENPRDNLTNVIDSICSVKYNKIQVLNGKTFYKFILSGTNREITSIHKLSLKEDQSEFNRVHSVAINDFAVLGSHGLRFDDNDNLQIFINKTAITVNMNVFKFTYVSNLCSNSQIKHYAMHPVNLRITDFLQFGAVSNNAKTERTINNIDTSIITNKGAYKAMTADGKYIDYKKAILDDLEGRRQLAIKSSQDASENRKTVYNTNINSINAEIVSATNAKRNFTVKDNLFLNVLKLYNRNGTRIFDYASGYKNNSLRDIPIPDGVEAIFVDSSDICLVFKNNSNQNQKSYSLFVPQGVSYDCDILIVGGGGSGGFNHGGGGGGGALIYSTNVSFPNNTYTITVGQGGASTTRLGAGNKGHNSSITGDSFGTIYTAEGGGYGGGHAVPQAGSGGSGGGEGGNPGGMEVSTTRVAGANNSLYGFNGGTSRTTTSGSLNWLGGGGGGAGSVGENSTNTNQKAGNGGSGKTISITGSDVIYAGGGGGSSLPAGGINGTGGSGGGGDAGASGVAGTDGLGGGGGAAGGPGVSPIISGKGGSGIVIIRIKKRIKINAIKN
jgi:hypothetical protein